MEPESHLQRYQHSDELLVVGMEHGLNRAEERELEQIIREVDYVGLEWDDIRQNGGVAIYSSPFRKTRAINGALYAGMLDYISVAIGTYMLKKRLRSRFIKKGGEGDWRDHNEHHYAQEVCREIGKPCYLVDRSPDESLKIWLDSKCKLNIFGFYNAILRDCYDRSMHMLDEMKRMSQRHSGEKGMLLVGEYHLIDIKAGDRETAERIRASMK